MIITSFMILPIQFLTEGEQKHAAGLLIHRHNDQYVLSILDKARFFNNGLAAISRSLRKI